MTRPATTLPPQKASDSDSKVEKDHFVYPQTPKENCQEELHRYSTNVEEDESCILTKTVILFPEMRPRSLAGYPT